VQLSGVDTDSIIEQARREDNQGNRIRRVRQMLFEQLHITGEGEFEQYHEFLWRYTKRNCTVLFRNIRELPDSSLENSQADWKLVIDFPFDEAGHGPRDDLSTIQRFLQSHPRGANTLCWVPSFFSHEAQKDLGMLVILEHILTGERFGQYSSHLSPQDRPAAKSVLESQRSMLRQRVQNHLDAAYGLDAASHGSLDPTQELELSEQYVALCPGFEPQPPVAANLAGAMRDLLSQALQHEFPAAPNFETEIKSSVLKKVYELVLPATQSSDGRAAIDKPLRPLLRQVANPLLIGEMGVEATHFVLGQHWKAHFSRKAAEAGGAMGVAQLRRWIDEPKPMGLPKEGQNLVILLFAAQTNRTLYRHSGPYDNATLQNIPDDCELRSVDLPDDRTWEIAVQRAGSIFGMAPPRLLSANNVSAVVSELKKKADESRRCCQAYSQRLKERMAKLSLKSDETDRLRTAVATRALLERIHAADPGAVVAQLTGASVATSESAMGECLSKAAELEGNLDTANWEIFDAIGKLTDGRQAEAREILAEVNAALSSDEHVIQLAPALKGAQAKAVRLLTATTPPRPPDVKPPIQPPVPPGSEIVDQGTKQDLTLSAAEEVLETLKKRVQDGQTARINLGWVIEKGRAS
jgi:hypothetical protein